MMPPFPGNDAQRRAVASHLATLAAKEDASDAPALGDVPARRRPAADARAGRVLFRGLLLLTFLLHLVPMNLVLGGALLALVDTSDRRIPRRARDTARSAAFTTALPTLIAATITFGVAPLLFLQVLYGRAFFGSAVLMAWSWISR